MILIILILIMIIIFMSGWIYNFNKRLEKLEILVEIKKPKAENKENNLGCLEFTPYSSRPHEIYNIQVNIIEKVGDKYLVKFVESYPTMDKQLKNVLFTNNKTLVTALDLGLDK